MGLHEHMNG